VTDDDAEDIAAWQASWNTPAEVLDTVVRRAVGSGIALDERLLEGHGNEVHAITTADGQDLVVRIGHRVGASFESESWPISAARSAGLPVPQTLLVDRAEIDGKHVPVQVQQRVPGRPVHRLFDELPDEDLTTLTIKAGRLLAALHGIRPPGVGPIDPQGNTDETWPPPSNAMVAAMVERNRQLAHQGFERALLDAPLEAVTANVELLDEAPVSLIHGDWRTTNVLSDGTSITGIVDWEGSRGGDPAFDFAGVWTVRSRSGPTSTETLMRGYSAGGGLIDDRFTLRRCLYRIADLHSALGHFVVTHRPDLLELAMTDLLSALGQFRALT
jgi:aminoglycoside phosphotransferase (APT) family kinase protein